MCKYSLYQILLLFCALFPTICYNFYLGLSTVLLINYYNLLIDLASRFFLTPQFILQTGTEIILSTHCSNDVPALLKAIFLFLFLFFWPGQKGSPQSWLFIPISAL